MESVGLAATKYESRLRSSSPNDDGEGTITCKLTTLPRLALTKLVRSMLTAFPGCMTVTVVSGVPVLLKLLRFRPGALAAVMPVSVQEVSATELTCKLSGVLSGSEPVKAVRFKVADRGAVVTEERSNLK